MSNNQEMNEQNHTRGAYRRPHRESQLLKVGKVLEDTGIDPKSPQYKPLRRAFAKEFIESAIENRTDSLTGLLNHRGFETRYEEEVKRAVRYATSGEDFPLVFFSLDINDLKKENDTNGHKAGDKLIKKTAKIFKDSSRPGDIAARKGGDEFYLLLNNISLEDAKQYWERINLLFELDNISISAGAVLVDINDPEYSEKKADQMMYKAKEKSKIENRNILVTTENG